MSRTIPVHYYGQAVTQAVVDDSLVQELDASYRFRVEVPASLRRKGFSADVIAAMIHEDETIAKLCHPVITLTGSSVINIRLSRIVLRSELVAHLNEIVATPRNNPRKERLIFDCLKLTKSVNRVVFVNSDRRDCRIENLREITVDSPLDLTEGRFDLE